MSDIAAWLDARTPPPPESLRRAVDRMLERTAAPPGDPLPERLAAVALDALGRVARQPSDRSTAMELLAVDALLTYAAEAAAERGPEALDRLLTTLEPPRFATLLEAEPQ